MFKDSPVRATYPAIPVPIGKRISLSNTWSWLAFRWFMGDGVVVVVLDAGSEGFRSFGVGVIDVDEEDVEVEEIDDLEGEAADWLRSDPETSNILAYSSCVLESTRKSDARSAFTSFLANVCIVIIIMESKWSGHQKSWDQMKRNIIEPFELPEMKHFYIMLFLPWFWQLTYPYRPCHGRLTWRKKVN